MYGVHRVRNKPVLNEESEGAKYLKSYRAVPHKEHDGLAAQNPDRHAHTDVCTI